MRRTHIFNLTGCLHAREPLVGTVGKLEVAIYNARKRSRSGANCFNSQRNISKVSVEILVSFANDNPFRNQ